MPAPTGYTTVSAVKLSDASHTLIANATISFEPVTSSGVVTSFHAGGGGAIVSSPVSATVLNGAFTIDLADTTLTQPVNIGYRVTVTDNVTGKSLLGPGYSCIQPYGATWSLDDYQANVAAVATVQTGPRGIQGLPNNLTIGTVTTTGTLASATITGATPNQVLNLALPKGDTGATGATGASPAFESRQPNMTPSLKGNVVAAGAERVIYECLGSGTFENLEMAFSGVDPLAHQTCQIKIEVDGRTYVSSMAMFFMTYGNTDVYSDATKQRTYKIQPQAPIYFNTDNITISSIGAGNFGGFRRIHIPHKYGLRISLVNTTASNVTIWTSMEANKGQAPAGLYPPTQTAFVLQTNEPADHTLNAYDQLTLLSPQTDGGEIASWFLCVKAPCTDIKNWNATFLEARPIVTIDGVQSYLANGTEDAFQGQFYFDFPTRNVEAGLARFGPDAAGSNIYMNAWRYFQRKKLVANSSMAFTWSNGEAGAPGPPPVIQAGSSVVAYLKNHPPRTLPAGWTKVAEYDAANITGVADGADVTTWPDSSGSGIDLNVGYNGNRYPSYIASSSMGGKPAVHFDRVRGECLGNHLTAIPSPNGTVKGRMIFCVMNIPDTTSNVDNCFAVSVGFFNSILGCDIQTLCVASAGIKFGAPNGATSTVPFTPATPTLAMVAWNSDDVNCNRISVNGTEMRFNVAIPAVKNAQYGITLGANIFHNDQTPPLSGAATGYGGAFQGDIAYVAIWDWSGDTNYVDAVQNGGAYIAEQIMAKGYGITPAGGGW